MSDNALLFKGKSFKFQETVESLNGMTWFGPPGVTILWQPMNAGFGKLFKDLVSTEHYHYHYHYAKLDHDWAQQLSQ